jgi:hypothetical protein
MMFRLSINLLKGKKEFKEHLPRSLLIQYLQKNQKSLSTQEDISNLNIKKSRSHRIISKKLVMKELLQGIIKMATRNL